MVAATRTDRCLVLNVVLWRHSPWPSSLFGQLREILERFLEALACMDPCFVSGQALECLSSPSRIGALRVGGLDLDCPRTRRVANALMALSAQPFGFSCSQLAVHVRDQKSQQTAPYTRRQASYDLLKLRSKRVIGYFPGSKRFYRVLPEGLRIISATILLRDHVLRPLLAAAHSRVQAPASEPSTPLDKRYLRLRELMQETLSYLSFAA